MHEHPPGFQVTRLVFYSCFRCHTSTQAPQSDEQCHPLCCVHLGTRLAPSAYCITISPLVAYISLSLPTPPVLNPLAPLVVTRLWSALQWTCNAPFWGKWRTHGPLAHLTDWITIAPASHSPTHFLCIPWARHSCWTSGPFMNAPCSFITMKTTHPTTKCHASEVPKPPFLTTSLILFLIHRTPSPLQISFSILLCIYFISHTPCVSPFSVHYCLLLSSPLCSSHKWPFYKSAHIWVSAFFHFSHCWSSILVQPVPIPAPTDQLLTTHSTFTIYLKKNGQTAS